MKLCDSLQIMGPGSNSELSARSKSNTKHFRFSSRFLNSVSDERLRPRGGQQHPKHHTAKSPEV